jgi:hypothetical protein
VREIVGDQNQAVNLRRRRDQDVRVIDDRALLAKSREDLCGSNHDLIAQGEHNVALAQPIEGLDLAKGIFRLQATKDLVPGNDRELKPMVANQILLSLTLAGEIPPLDDLRKRIAVEKKRPRGHSGWRRKNRLRSSAISSTSAMSSSESPA